MYDLISELTRGIFTSYDRYQTTVEFIQDREARLQLNEAGVKEIEAKIESAEKLLNEAKLANKATINGLTLAEVEETINESKVWVEEQKKKILSLKGNIGEAKRLLAAAVGAAG